MNTPQQAHPVDVALASFDRFVPPSSLYRFHSKSGLPALTLGQLKLTPPSKFNDPFELSPGITSASLTGEGIRRNFLVDGGLTRQVYANKFADAAKYHEWVEQTVLKNPDKWHEHFAALRASVTETTSGLYGICCFSAFNEEMLNGPIGIRHWAMYAADHTGFVIEYDGTHKFLRDYAESKWLFPVKYYEQRPKISLDVFESWNGTTIIQTLRSWSEAKCLHAWGHEAEWRFICPLGDNPSIPVGHKEIDGKKIHFLNLLGIEKAVIKRVIIGERAEPALVTDLKKHLQRPDFKHVKLEQVRLSTSDFRLHTVPV